MCDFKQKLHCQIFLLSNGARHTNAAGSVLLDVLDVLHHAIQLKQVTDQIPLRFTKAFGPRMVAHAVCLLEISTDYWG